MKLISALLIFLISTTNNVRISGHFKDPNKGKRICIKNLYNCWTDSREEYEQGSSLRIYRPCEFKAFPLSRFRHRIEFKENGECSSLQLAPNDAHFMASANWTYDKATKMITAKDESGKIMFKAKLITLTKDLMKIEREK